MYQDTKIYLDTSCQRQVLVIGGSNWFKLLNKECIEGWHWENYFCVTMFWLCKVLFELNQGHKIII
jgi:hypothetical protein